MQCTPHKRALITKLVLSQAGRICLLLSDLGNYSFQLQLSLEFYNIFLISTRFEPAANGIPSSVFFPQSDPEDRLSQCSASLQSLLALSPTSLHALSKLVLSSDCAHDIIGVMQTVLSQFPPKGSETSDANIDISLSVRIWRISGCHELLASLGLDLMEVGKDEVTLRTGKHANRRNCQFVLQALLALFGT